MSDKVALRRRSKIAGILDAAWALAQENGVAGVSLHALAREVGMRQPSLYAYFDSKNALFDAMFADGNQQLWERLDALELSQDPRAALREWLDTFVAFLVEDPARHALMMQRPIPGFEPSPESFAIAGRVLDQGVGLMRALGVTAQGDIDCLVAVTAGLVDAQISNEPGGTRWVQHLDRLLDLLVDDALTRRNAS